MNKQVKWEMLVFVTGLSSFSRGFGLLHVLPSQTKFDLVLLSPWFCVEFNLLSLFLYLFVFAPFGLCGFGCSPRAERGQYAGDL